MARARSRRFAQRPAAAVRIALVVALVLGVLALSPTEASAAPTVTLSSTTVSDGDTITVTTSDVVDVADATWQFSLCSSSSQSNQCDVLTPVLDEPPSSVAVTVHDRPQTAAGGLECSDLALGCVIVLTRTIGLTENGWAARRTEASATITVLPPPWTVQASPSQLSAGQTTTLTLSGFPAGPGVVAMCLPAVDLDDAPTSCDTLATYPDGLPATVTTRVPSTFATAHPGSGCQVRCAIGAYVTGTDPSEVVAADVDLIRVSAPTVTVTPNLSTADTEVVQVSGSALPPGAVGLAQCTGGGQSSTFTAADCTVPVPATVADDWTLDATFTATERYATADGSEEACLATFEPTLKLSCLVAVLLPTGRFVAVAPIHFGGPEVLVDRRAPVENDDVLIVIPVGIPSPEVSVATCAMPVADTLATSRCDAAGRPFPTVGVGVALFDSYDVTSIFPTSAGSVDCHVETCVVAAFDADRQRVAVSDPLTFREPYRMTMSPSTDRLEGQQMPISISGLAPGRKYRIFRCIAGTAPVSERCAAPEGSANPPSAEGKITSSRQARQRFTDQSGHHRFCRAQCTIEIAEDNYYWDEPSRASASYTMATPKVSASPATGLTDGDTVTVSGSSLGPSYAGPPVWLPTGGWGLAQCDAAVGSAPSLVDAFTHCAFPAGGPVAVPGSTSSSAVAVQGTITKVLGGTTDCTAEAGACVVGLVRWEQDATVSSAFTPLIFG